MPNINESLPTETEEIQTCGKGLAENSVLPRKLGALILGLADVLDLHIEALDLNDENARLERDAYEKLVRENRQTAEQLEATANEMAGYRDLPMGAHDEHAMNDVRFFEAFEQFVRTKQELISLLESGVSHDQEILDWMRTASQEQGRGKSQTAKS